MRRFFARARALHERGVLGINQRNGGLVLPLNPRRHYPRVDDKLITKRLAQAAGIPIAALARGRHLSPPAARAARACWTGLEQFVLKPARGAQGNGIVVITGIEDGSLSQEQRRAC